MTKTEIFKKTASLVTNHAAGFATARVIVANAPTNGGLYERACVVIGAVAVGTFVGAKTSQFVEDTIDEIVGAIESGKNVHVTTL